MREAAHPSRQLTRRNLKRQRSPIPDPATEHTADQPPIRAPVGDLRSAPIGRLPPLADAQLDHDFDARVAPEVAAQQLV
jgi:hypothetical protein